MMKKAALINLLLLYGIVMCLYNDSRFFQNSLFTEQGNIPQSETYQSVNSKDFVCHTIQTENPALSQANASSSFKNQFADFTVLIRSSARVFQSKFVQYHFFSRNLLHSLRQYEIVFPFHNFW
jgi:hypothetical protein